MDEGSEGEPESREARLEVKVVPGASRDQIAGMLGERVKIRVAAAPEGGKANESVRRLIARALGVPIRSVTIIAGQTRPEKTVEVEGISPVEVRRRLKLG